MKPVCQKQIARLLGALATTLLSTVAQANTESEEYDNGRFGGWLIDTLFQSGTIMEPPADPGLIGTIIWPLSVACTIVALVVIGFKAIQHLLVVAQAKDVDSSPISMTWSPIHICFAIALCLPFPSGYTAGQYFAIWLAHQSNHLGNITADRTTKFFNERGVPNPPPLPSSAEIVESLVHSAMCMEINNIVHAYMVSENPDAGSAQVRASLMTPERVAQHENSGGSGNFTHHGIEFERTGPGVAIAASSVPHCGGIIVSFNTQSWEATPLSGPATNDGFLDIGEMSHNPSRWSLARLFGPSEGDINQAVMFREANSRIRNELLDIAQSEELVSIAKNLLYDMEATMGTGTSEEEQVHLAQLAADQESRTLLAASGAMQLTDRIHAMMYRAYAQALSNNVTTENNLGDRWTDSINRVGWPLIGLYWFQMSSTSQSIMDAIALKVSPLPDNDSAGEDLLRLTGDSLLSEKIADRYYRFQTSYAQRLRNTRLDPNPTGEPQTVDGEDIIGKLKNKSALEIRELFPMVKDSLISGGGQMSSRDGVMGYFDEYARNTMFPGIVNILREDHIVTSLVSAGHWIIAIAEAAYFSNKLLEAWQKRQQEVAQKEAAKQPEPKKKGMWQRSKDAIGNTLSKLPGVGAAISLYNFTTAGLSMLGDAVIEMIKDALGLLKWLMFPALFMAFYLPAMIMIQWLTGLVTWLLYIVEATIVIPLWGILFVSDLGQQAWAPQSARQGFVHFLSILIYPSLMVIGFMVAYQVLDLASTFLIDFLLLGFINATAGYTFGVLSMVAGLFIIAIACYQIIMRVFSITLELNDRVISWIGQRMSYGETGVEQQARAGVMAVVGKLEMLNRHGPKNPQEEGQQGGQGRNPAQRLGRK